MKYYESLYIVNPNYEQGKLDEVMKTVSETISEYGFKTINHFVWGKKRLAYNIQEHKYGSYVMLHFETESLENLDSFERFMVLQKPVLRNQTIALDEKPEKHIEKASSSEENKKNESKGLVEKTVKSSNGVKSKDKEQNNMKVVEEEAPEVEKETEEEAPEEEAPEVEKETEEEVLEESEQNKENQ